MAMGVSHNHASDRESTAGLLHLDLQYASRILHKTVGYVLITDVRQSIT